MVGADTAELSDEDVAAAAAAQQLQDECWLSLASFLYFVGLPVTTLQHCSVDNAGSDHNWSTELPG